MRATKRSDNNDAMVRRGSGAKPFKVVALLESMWGGSAGAAPRFFSINPNNFSGRRLYRICGGADLLVTNSCRTMQRHANKHGVPDPQWVADNLTQAYKDGCQLVLVCGKVAQATYAASGLNLPNVLHIAHPADRRWTNAALDKVALEISNWYVKE